MTKKNKKRRKVTAVLAENDRQRNIHRRRFSWSKGVGIILAVICVIAVIAYFMIPREQNKIAESQDQTGDIPVKPTSSESLPKSAGVPVKATVIPESLPRSDYTPGKPINKYDPVSGKPIVAGITSTYKGYTIGHCCDVSRQEWVYKGEKEKDAFIRVTLRK